MAVGAAAAGVAAGAAAWPPASVPARGYDADTCPLGCVNTLRAPFHVKRAQGSNPPISRRSRGIQAAVAELAARYGLADDALPRMIRLVELLASDPLAPTTLRDPQQILCDHLADSLVALDLEEVRAAESIADLGAGAGLPGLPLAIALPDAHVFMVESNGRKCEFIARAIETGEVPNAQVVCARAEEWPCRGCLDLVTARALASLPVVAEYAAPLLRIGGALLAWRGRRDPEEEAAARRAADELGLRMREPQRVQPYPGAQNRHLQLLVKVAHTPTRFPRRPGMARKRPLGAGPRRQSGTPNRPLGEDPGH